MRRALIAAALCLMALPAMAEWTEDAELCATIIGNHQKALDHCDAAIASGRLDEVELTSTYVNRAYELYRLNRTGDAIESASAAILLSPENPRGWVNRGTYRQSLDQLEAAHDDFVHALDLIARTSEGFGQTTAGVGPFYGANLGLARINRRWGRRDVGLGYARTAFEMRPDGDPDLFAWYGLR